jgi:hypothetical protein
LRHRSVCRRCAALAVRASIFERHLEAALLGPAQAQIPAVLVERIMTNHWSSLPRERSYALVASVLLLVVLTLSGSSLRLVPSLENAIVAHLDAERHALAQRALVKQETVKATLQPLGVELSTDLGEVTYARLCTIGQRPAAHFVLAGEQAPVTVLLLRGEHVLRPRSISTGAWAGMLLPVSGGGLAILGSPNERLDLVERQLRAGLRWLL